MSEQSTEEDETVVQRAYSGALEALAAGETLSPQIRLIHDVEHLMQEVNSGASFEQYFRWAPVGEIAAICRHLETAGIDDVAQLTREAIGVAFPNGLPPTDDEKSEATDWTEEQEEALGALFPQLEDQTGRVTRLLAAHARRIGV
jgi:hypothetical protein